MDRYSARIIGTCSPVAHPYRFIMKFSTRISLCLLVFASVILLQSAVTAAEEHSTIKPKSDPSSKVVPAHSNRLAKEKSPYLLQHAHNPVDWYPWGDEAFEKARSENKPVFLSVGYSTCHWCHVMERESFQNEGIAAYLNKNFVSIKVDREERPDVDKIYMTFVQSTTGGGGWPTNVFITPDRKPFYGGTYFPPTGEGGRPGFKSLLERIHELWTTKHATVLTSAADIAVQIETHLTKEPSEKPKLNQDLLSGAVMSISKSFDPTHGGYGSEPKFPTPPLPALVLRYGVSHENKGLIDQAILTGDRMAAGGIHDQLGGGFSRYSVDEQWLIPHFEKMLYDNAQLLDFYLDLYLVTGEQRFADVSRDILRYLLRDMTHPDGGFFSAEDADSEGYEGKFHTWTLSELKEILTVDELRVVVRHFGITEKGNFVDHSHPAPLPNQNVLSIVDPKLSPPEIKLLESAKAKMFEVKQQRIRPRLDDKILVSWNGLMLGPLARAGVVLNEPAFRAAAEKNLAFIQSKLWDSETKTLYHRWRDGNRDSVQLLDAYAYLLSGVLTHYETTLSERHLEFAIQLADAMLARFQDSKDGGFWQSGVDSKDLILRVKEDYDGAQPSANSVATLALLKLGDITGQARFRQAAEKSLKFFADRMRNSPAGSAYMCQALDYWLSEPSRVVITGKDVQPLITATHAVYQPNKVVLGNKGPVEEFAATMKDGDQSEANVCTGKTCQPPTRDTGKLKQSLSIHHSR